MILSMTGFGKAVVDTEQRRVTVEIKSLNSKQLDLSVRVPQFYRELEPDLRNRVSASLLRGKVELNVNCENTGDNTTSSINLPILKTYKAQIEQMSSELGIPQPTDWYATLLRLPEALKSDAAASEIDQQDAAAVTQATDTAIDALIAFRTQEGKRLEIFFEEKIAAIRALLDRVPQYEQARVEKIKARIIDSLSKLEGVEYDNNRLEQELIFYIEKLDITEEKIRLSNHLKYFLDTLHNESGQGKKLGFISQEMGREINTMGSKANQAELQNIVVQMKDHLEQIKEQVLNVL
ncbi:MAG: YicC family protein [Muribaculaceae bacterium]|nr:YicC family protein [Muribaculaceae bacterium]